MKKTSLRTAVAAAAVAACAACTSPASQGNGGSDPEVLAKIPGSHWMLDMKKGAECEVTPEVNFKKDGTMHGNSGCNDFRGKWRIENGKLLTEYYLVTRRTCGPVYRKTEETFSRAMTEVRTVKGDGDGFILVSEKGETLAKLVPETAGACN